MRQRTFPLASAVLLMLSGASSATAQGRAQGAIVTRDNAPIYENSTGSKVVDTRMRGEYVVGVTTMFNPPDSAGESLTRNVREQLGGRHV